MQTSDTLNNLTFGYSYNGGGVAVADFNNDSLPDLFFTGNMVSSRLYLNMGNFKFRDVTEEAGLETHRWCTGAAIGDVNGDGLPDIYVAVSQSSSASGRANLCFINKGNLKFEEKAVELGIADTAYSTHAAFLDYDKDGDLDLYVLNTTNDDLPRIIVRNKIVDGSASSNDQLYRNDGDAGFTKVTLEAGILHEGFGLGVGIHDFNRDGWPDILVTNDYLSDDLLYINQQDGTFQESSAAYLKHLSHFAMGHDIADLNHDGLAEVITLDMLPEDNYRKKMMSGDMNYDKFKFSLDFGYQPQYMRNMLQMARRLPDGRIDYAEVGAFSGIYATDWSWSPLMADFDNDGWRDIAITNGYRRDVTNRDFITYRSNLRSEEEVRAAIDTLAGAHVSNYIYKNMGGMRFLNQTEAWGMKRPSFSNGAVFADLDLDGDLDYVVSNLDEPPYVYKNNSRQQNENHYLRVRLLGAEQNFLALGGEVSIFYDGKTQYEYFSPYRGFQSSVEPVIHFGLGNHKLVDSLLVKWPDGRISKKVAIPADQLLSLSYVDAQAAPASPATKQAQTLFKSVSQKHHIHFRHQADPYIDFNDDALLLHEYTNLGPSLAVGDVNGDGKEDFFIGGDRDKSGCFFIQQENAQFEAKPFLLDTAYHDMGSLLFDADQDGDLDLYVASGGNQWPAGHRMYQDRLYLNDGEGNFTLSDALPDTRISSGSVKAADYDRDGDLDLLVSARLTPQQYPLPNSSLLLRNDSQQGKAVFVEAGLETAPALQETGLVSDALWTDFNNDSWPDIILLGEWMPVKILLNRQGKFVDITKESGLSDSHGWWNSISGADLDADGDTDYLLGNLGLNSTLKASQDEPLKIYAKDFDQNGEIDPILFHYSQGRSVPLHSRDAIMDQLYRLKAAFPYYDDFAKTSEMDFLTKNDRETSYYAQATTLYSAWLENHGDGSFSLHPLPDELQFAPVFGMQPVDLNGDALPDILAVGNLYSAETVSGQYDASVGTLLLADGEGNWEPMSTQKSGFYVPGDAKSLVRLSLDKQQEIYLAGVNNDSLRVLSLSDPQDMMLYPLRQEDAFAWLEKEGKRWKVEFYHGDTYLGHSSRTLRLPRGTKATIVTYRGEERILTKE
ncbi:MAG: VCBS repeat-containing protein [Cyclobacteriaceae bacterium]